MVRNRINTGENDVLFNHRLAQMRRKSGKVDTNVEVWKRWYGVVCSFFGATWWTSFEGANDGY